MEINLDFNAAPPQRGDGPEIPEWAQGPSSLDANEVKARLLSSLENVLGHLFPAGFADLKARTFYIGDVGGGAGESLNVQLGGTAAGLWYDFATGEGGDILDLWREARGTGDFRTTLKDAAEYVGAVQNVPRRMPKRKASAKTCDGIPTHTYQYRDAMGALIAEVERFEWVKENGARGKAFRPWDVSQRAFRAPDPRPLYNLPNVATAPEIVLVEGEKCADALIACNIDATTAMGGSNAPIDKTDWAPLAGKKVLIWPDNDEPGKKYAEAAAHAIRLAGALSVDILTIPDGKGEKWDAADAVEDGENPRDLIRRMKQDANQGHTALFFPACLLAGHPVPPREWHVADLIPGKTITIIGGDGGTGKSLLGFQLSVATAAGIPWLGRDIVAPGTAMFLSAEDDQDELHRRLADICRAEHIGMECLDRLLIRSLAGQDALLAALDRKSGALVPTPLYMALEAEVAERKPSLLTLDTLADLHSGEENNRAHARQFIGLLRGIAIRHNVAIVLLAHPSLAGMATGTGLSGSTAWNASVRSRLYLDRIKEDGYEPDPDARILTTKKSNYGRTGGEIKLRWEDGVFIPEPVESTLGRMAGDARAERVFLKMLALFESQGRTTNAAGGQYYAPNLFSGHAEAEGVTRKGFKDAMESLLTRGVLVIVPYGPPSKKYRKLAIAGTHGGAA